MDLTEPQASLGSCKRFSPNQDISNEFVCNYLASVVYPCSELWPKPNSSRLTHSELHAMVMMENNMSTIMASQHGRQKTRNKNYRQLFIPWSRPPSTFPRVSPLTPQRQLPVPPLSASHSSSAFDLMSSFTNEVLLNSKQASVIRRSSSAFGTGFQGSAYSSDTSDVSP